MPKRPNEPESVPVRGESDAEMEAAILARIAQVEDALETGLLTLARFYSRTGRQDKAVPRLERFAQYVEDPAIKASVSLATGQLIEQLDDCERAVPHYQRGPSVESDDPKIQYFLNNNLAFCLCSLGRHSEAEPYARGAIEIDPDRHNAHKNLAMSLEGQARHAAAADSYARAVELCPEDVRALMQMEQMVSENPSLLEEVPALPGQLRACRELVDRTKEGFH
jgi:tetratricopeptide (TPR) repeat protein